MAKKLRTHCAMPNRELRVAEWMNARSDLKATQHCRLEAQIFPTLLHIVKWSFEVLDLK
jgi:hypothetical protein